MKVLLALKHKTLPPTANYSAPAESLGMENSPFTVLSESRPWPARGADQPRKAAVSALGFGGINGALVFKNTE